MMIAIDIKDLTIPDNRQRREFDPDGLRELADSIEDKGLMHPLVVRNDGRTLVAGERRFKAIQLLFDAGKQVRCNDQLVPPDHVPVLLLQDLDPLQLEEAELEENIVRKDLTWQERSAAHARLHELRSKQRDASGDEPQRLEDTIKEITGGTSARQRQNLSEDLILTQHLDDPEVASAKSRKEALKAVRKKKEREHRAKLAEKYDLSKDNEHDIQQGDSFELVKQLPDATFDIILTDPPYGVGADNFGSQADARHEYSDDWDFAAKCYELVASQGWRVTKPDAHLYAFCDVAMFGAIQAIFGAAGWTVFPSPLIWDKRPIGMLPYPDYGPRLTYEGIVYAWRGDRKTSGVFSDIVSVAGMARPMFGAQKPWELYEALLKRSAMPGDKVLDMFAGAGPLLKAASKHRCRATLLEQNHDKVNYMRTLEDEEPADNDEENIVESLFQETSG